MTLQLSSELIKVLIEPMWNWNSQVSVFRSSSLMVLIEPMWNWNEIPYEDYFTENVSFNRTNVELKLKSLLPEAYERPGFNRTNVELKRTSSSYLSLRGDTVLIEPMWNWNGSTITILTDWVTVLIEPMWNWTKTNWITDKAIKIVLIEPMWNWNKCS